MNLQAGPRYVGMEHFAGVTGLSPRFVAKLVAREAIPSIKVGRRRLVPLDRALAALERLSEMDARSPKEPNP
jgi:hypothetical protein